ncbi:MAG: hypothetical protein QHC67_00775 [Sphingobium sp.]|uniref:hypothetical protein n=1 Tax=Sphingobium sp. TaxID=1912891 RepID=UPI0029A6A78F|nr:hypothetical protein [Sphingobium sp.]MDX3908343.1 hypothetical protein [Sphingobium sp.]
MTASPPPPVDPTAAARQRLLFINLFRLSGVFILMFGFLIMMQRFGWVQGRDAKILGAIIATVGLLQTIVIPRVLLRAWRTPPAD